MSVFVLIRAFLWPHLSAETSEVNTNRKKRQRLLSDPPRPSFSISFIYFSFVFVFREATQ